MTNQPHSHLTPSARPRHSPLHGTGLFAVDPIRRGEIVMRLGGRLIDDELAHPRDRGVEPGRKPAETKQVTAVRSTPMRKIAILSGAVMLTAGCQLGQAPPPSPPAQTTSSQASASPSAAASLPPDQVIGSREITGNNWYKVRIDLYAIQRQDKLITVNFAATVLEHDRASGWDVGSTFSAVPSDTPTVDGVYLVDTKNAKKHLVAKDNEGTCLCSSGLVEIDTDKTVVFSATFAAPPPDVSTMDVFIPRAGTFKNVPRG